MPKSKARAERVINVVEVKCYLTNPDGDTHRIALTNTGRIIPVDHAWGSMKLLREMTKCSICCMDYITGMNVRGLKVTRAANVPKRPVSPTVSPAAPYLFRLRSGARDIFIKHTNISPTPYRGSFLIREHWYRGDETVPTPSWGRAPRGINSSHITMPYNTVDMVNAVKYEGILGTKHCLTKMPHRDIWNHTPVDYINSDNAYFQSWRMVHAVPAANTYIMGGWLVDPNIQDMPRRIKYAVAIWNSEAKTLTITRIEELSV
jgi:hypothetical protein